MIWVIFTATDRFHKFNIAVSSMSEPVHVLASSRVPHDIGNGTAGLVVPPTNIKDGTDFSFGESTFSFPNSILNRIHTFTSILIAPLPIVAPHNRSSSKYSSQFALATVLSYRNVDAGEKTGKFNPKPVRSKIYH